MSVELWQPKLSGHGEVSFWFEIFLFLDEPENFELSRNRALGGLSLDEIVVSRGVSTEATHRRLHPLQLSGTSATRFVSFYFQMSPVSLMSPMSQLFILDVWGTSTSVAIITMHGVQHRTQRCCNCQTDAQLRNH